MERMKLFERIDSWIRCTAFVENKRLRISRNRVLILCRFVMMDDKAVCDHVWIPISADEDVVAGDHIEFLGRPMPYIRKDGTEEMGFDKVLQLVNFTANRRNACHNQRRRAG